MEAQTRYTAARCGRRTAPSCLANINPEKCATQDSYFAVEADRATFGECSGTLCYALMLFWKADQARTSCQSLGSLRVAKIVLDNAALLNNNGQSFAIRNMVGRDGSWECNARIYPA